jgi:hypothetical protein
MICGFRRIEMLEKEFILTYILILWKKENIIDTKISIKKFSYK